MVVESRLGHGCWVRLVCWVGDVAFVCGGCADGFVCDGSVLLSEGSRSAHR